MSNEERLARKYTAALDTIMHAFYHRQTQGLTKYLAATEAFHRPHPWHVDDFLPALAYEWRRQHKH